WSTVAELRSQMAAAWKQVQSLTLLEGLANLADIEDDVPIAALSTARAQQIEKNRTADPFTEWPAAARQVKTEPLRIGYLSANFRRQAGGQLARGLFAAHDHNRVHVTAYALPPMDDSPYRRDPERDADDFVDLSNMTTLEAAERIRSDGIQVLIDMKGWSEFNRQDILALRPAPVQIHYLGHPAPMIAPWIDYQIVDPVVVNDAARQAFPNGLIYLPDTYQVNDSEQPVPGKGPSRRAVGLPTDATVLVIANTIYKISQPVFSLWMQVMAARPSTVLWMFGAHDIAKANLMAHARAAGVDPERLLFSPSIERAQHLTRLQGADLAFDTRPCGGHTTTADCLWAGLPVLTVTGEHFASRVSASLLRAAGLADLVSERAEGFANKALALIDNPEQRQLYRAQLTSRRHDLALFDTKARAHQLEAAFAAVWQRYCDGRAPSDIYIDH
ncbi:MAG: hypothetical protein AAF556_06440, partial [Pseudomonadota bacterium]